METLGKGLPLGVDAIESGKAIDCHEVIALTSLLLSLAPDTFSLRVQDAIQTTHDTAVCLAQEDKTSTPVPRVVLKDGEFPRLFVIKKSRLVSSYHFILNIFPVLVQLVPVKTQMSLAYRCHIESQLPTAESHMPCNPNGF